MRSSLLQSQLKDLEVPSADEAALTLSIQEHPDQLLAQVLEHLSAAKIEPK
ncbi:Gluconate kinase [Nitrincola nitratireducens]|uniref:Gluconate kinase n=2 Tax=Nitrincola TaxID=267849 RepID=W9VA08_9GAMM|nr:Gluconate kinase [Nitrincola nitratireducens]